MIPIKKHAEPKSFKKVKKDYPSITYEKFSTEEDFTIAFDELRKSLLDEQHYLCCYCQQAIKLEDEVTKKILMATEHFLPKHGSEAVPEQQLEYSNLLASCLGNKDSKKDNHCDANKGDRKLKALPNPAFIRQKNYNAFLKYRVKEKEGEVIVLPAINDETIKKDIEILNLNEPNLRKKRFAVWNAIWKKINVKGEIKIEQLPEILNNYVNKHLVFYGFISYWFKDYRFKEELKALKR